MKQLFSSAAVRLPWIDHLRTVLIVLVVNLHACVTYSHVGDWYIMSEHEPTLSQKLPFIVWQGHLQSFFMGLLFFISAYFAHGALSRRGPGAFVRERLLRLGAPAVLYMLVIHPFILIGLNPWDHAFGPAPAFYADYVLSGHFLSGSGPLWFAVALLLFSLALAAWRRVVPLRNCASEQGRAPSARLLGGCALALGGATFAVRLVQPIGTNVLNLQLCFFVQYICFFLAGVHAARHGWLLPLALSARARFAGKLTLCLSAPLLLAIIVVGAKTGKPSAFFGGWHWQAFAFALWEQLTGVGLSLGLLALFAQKFNAESARMRWLADRSFGVFLLHAPVIIALAMLFRALPQHMYLLVALLTVSGLALSFLLSDLARRIPVLRRMI
ncbi:MAG: acyltransferase family protein [Sphingomonadaceae bacterium]